MKTILIIVGALLSIVYLTTPEQPILAKHVVLALIFLLGAYLFMGAIEILWERYQ